MTTAQDQQSLALAPCPFCGERSAQPSSNGHESHMMVCECGAEGPPATDDREAITAWNRRSPAEQAAGALQQSRADFEADWRVRHAPLPMNTRMNDDGRYGDRRIQSEWESWVAGKWEARQAARSLPADVEPVARVRMGATANIEWREGMTYADLPAIDGHNLFTASQVLAMGRVPPGFQAVPVEPTPEMLAAYSSNPIHIAQAVAVHRALLAAAPQPPAAQERKPLTEEQCVSMFGRSHIPMIRAVEAAHGIKEGGSNAG